MKYVHKGALTRRVTDEEAERLKKQGFKELVVPAPVPKPEVDGMNDGEGDPDPNSEPNYKKMNKNVLEALAAEKGIEVPARATKEDIVKLLEAAESEEDHEE